MNYNKIIILDLDGVLATDDCFKNTEIKFGARIYRWSTKCVQVLNEVINETDCEIVLSSDWRKHFTLPELKEIFEWNNVVKSPIAVTDQQVSSMSRHYLNRINQIGRFLDNNEIKNWVCVDDMNLKSDIVSNFVLIEDTQIGISGEGIKEKLILFLNQKN
jgi:predicted metalloendopeptidase